jgi:DNA-binding transcriptional MerR regulator
MAMLATVREKSPEAFRTISEVATELDMPQHVLRFWESRFAQVRPIKRAGGRRYYRPEDVDLLRGIRALLYREGFTIKGAQKIMREKGQRYVAEIGRTANVTPIGFPAGDAPAEEPRHARAMLAVVERAHSDVEDVPGDVASKLADEEQLSLEVLLAELLQMKARLRAASPLREG